MTTIGGGEEQFQLILRDVIGQTDGMYVTETINVSVSGSTGESWICYYWDSKKGWAIQLELETGSISWPRKVVDCLGIIQSHDPVQVRDSYFVATERGVKKKFTIL